MTTIDSHIEEVENYTKTAVLAVFDTMLGISLSPSVSGPFPHQNEEEIASSVGFAGQTTGAIYIYSTVRLAQTLTGRMLGLDVGEVASREMVHDVMGELTNMIVGGVKSRLCDIGQTCSLTIPSIVRGLSLRIERPSRVTTRELSFAFDGNQLLVEIFIKTI